MNETTNIDSGETNIGAAASGTTRLMAQPARTPGWQTSEFWMTTLGHLGLILATAEGFLPAKYAVAAATASQVAYSLSRGLSKGASTAAAPKARAN